jgi:hypothetical protein
MERFKRVPPTEQPKDTFWIYAVLEKTYDRSHERNAVKRCKFDIQYGRGRFRARRRYKDPRTGERRETVEIWLDELNHEQED